MIVEMHTVDTDIDPGACGAPDQPCCFNGTCNPGATCQGETCHTVDPANPGGLIEGRDFGIAPVRAVILTDTSLIHTSDGRTLTLAEYKAKKAAAATSMTTTTKVAVAAAGLGLVGVLWYALK